MRVYSTGLLEVLFDTAQGRLHLQCLGKFNSVEFRDSLLAALQFAEENHIKHWLLDFSAIGNLNEAEENWLHTHLFPRIMMTMGTGNHIAIVLSDRSYQALLSEAGLFGLQSYNAFIIINMFAHAAEASAWLNSRAIPHAS